MTFRDADRAQSLQVGAILLFGILIIGLATVQATVVPDGNAAVEFDHSRAVQSDLQDLRNALLGAADGDATPTRVTLGTTYTNRVFFVNPPPADGRLRTVGADDPAMNVTIAGAGGSVSVDSEYENAREYWASAPDAGEYDTAGIAYTPDYSQYDGAPTTRYGNSVLFNTFDNGANRTLTGQRLVQGNTINLLALRGDLDASGTDAETVDVETLSEQARTVTVESDADDPLYVNVTSRLSASVWNDDLLGSNAQASTVGTPTINGETYYRIAIELDPGKYRLRGASVGVGAVSDPERESATEPAYLVVTEEYEPVANETNGTMTVEVRDRFNNPVTGADVGVRVDDDHLETFNDTTAGSEVTFRTDADGQATINYRGINNTSGSETAWLNASLSGASAGYEYRNVTGIEVPEVDLGGGDGDGGELNPGTTGDLIQRDATLYSNDEVDVTFENTLGEQVNVTGVRLNFYFYPGSGGGGPDNPPTEAQEVRVGSEVKATNVEIGGDYQFFDDDPIEIAADSESTITFAFDGNPKQEDFFVLSLVFEYDGQTYRETYFVAPR
ncbi:hypothetical protein [Halolamina rubra]|uniref:hypothetical protein n=1 Tax=Halolamina rubra TaxID=1380430 RepID=UPI0006790C9B|nr:hypothetical protein [Halolamina rubra]